MNDLKTSDRDLNRAIRSWLHEDRHEDASRLTGAVLDQVEATPRRRSTWWPARRTPIMNKFVTIGLGAAAVVVLVLVGAQILGPPSNLGGSGEATPTPVPAGTVEPTPEGLLSEGTHLLFDGGRQQISVAIPAPDWYGDVDNAVLVKNDNADAPDGAGLLVFAGTTAVLPKDLYVYGDPCHWETTRPDTPVNTVDEAVTALASQASRDASTPIDITVDGHAGKLIILHVPDDARFSDCDQGEFRTLVEEYDDGSGTGARFAQDPGQIDKLWVLYGNDGVVIIDAAYYEGTPQSVIDELDAIVASARLTSP